MSLKNSLVGNAAVASATPASSAPVAPAPEQPGAKPPVASTKEGGKKKAGNSKNAAFEKFKASGVSAREAYTEQDKEIECSKSNAVQFVVALANPARSMKRVQGGESLDSFQVVGYKFKALEPVKVPRAVQLPDAVTLMDCEVAEWVDVAAGEEFDLTLFETGTMISQIEYGGTFSGGGDQVNLHVTVAANRGDQPLTVLKRPSAPIKDKLVLIADVNEVDGVKTYTVKPEYAEKFGHLFVRKRGNRGNGVGTKATSEPYKDLAAAFRNYDAKLHRK